MKRTVPVWPRAPVGPGEVGVCGDSRGGCADVDADADDAVDAVGSGYCELLLAVVAVAAAAELFVLFLLLLWWWWRDSEEDRMPLTLGVLLVEVEVEVVLILYLFDDVGTREDDEVAAEGLLLVEETTS